MRAMTVVGEIQSSNFSYIELRLVLLVPLGCGQVAMIVVGCFHFDVVLMDSRRWLVPRYLRIELRVLVLLLLLFLLLLMMMTLVMVLLVLLLDLVLWGKL